MKAKIVLIARVKIGDGKDAQFPFVPVAFKKGRPVEPSGATSYYLRYSENGKRRVEPVGGNLEVAHTSFLNREHQFSRQKAGLLPITEFDSKSEVTPAAQTISDAVEKFILDHRAIGNAESTVDMYSKTARDFAKVCAARSTVTLDQITREDLLAYLVWMRKNLRRQAFGSREGTLAARMRRLNTFLRRNGIRMRKDDSPMPDDRGLLDHRDVPKVPAKPATKYSKRAVSALLAAAEKAGNVDAVDLIQFLLCTGFRDEEVAYCEWSDINFREGTINVHEKLRTAERPWAWRPKDKESRAHDIPVPPAFVARMKARRARLDSKCALIFPSRACKPDLNLLRRIRPVALAAGVEDRITLHAFRRTFGSTVAAAFGIETARQFLGHSKVATTQRYIAADSDEIDRVKQAVGNLYSEFGM